MRSILFLLILVLSANSAKITQITGAGRVNSKRAKLGMTIVEGDTITADDESEIYISITEGSGVTIKNGSTMIMGEEDCGKIPSQNSLDSIVAGDDQDKED